MNIDNNEITRTIAQDKEKGFRLLMAKFSEPYTGTSAVWW